MAVITTAQGRTLAYEMTQGTGPCIVFLSGLKSDMQGTKAVHLEAWARAQGRAFLRFDYSGHGESSGAFTDGCIGDWAEDTAAMLETVAGPLVLVGSSMGGWQSLLAAKRSPDQLVLRSPLDLPCPVRFLQGTADEDVDMSVALRLLEHASGTDMRLTLVDGADHRFSDAACLRLIETAVQDVLDASEAAS